MYLIYTTKLDLQIKKINVSMQNIERSYLDIFGIVLVNYSVEEKLGKI